VVFAIVALVAGVTTVQVVNARERDQQRQEHVDDLVCAMGGGCDD
jgi:tRNA G37 N-methylase TrmD